MQLGNFIIRRHYTIWQIILDIASLWFFVNIIWYICDLAAAVTAFNNRFLDTAANTSGKLLLWTPALVWVVAAAGFIIMTIVITHRKHQKLPTNFTIIGATAQKYYDLRITGHSAVRVIALLLILEAAQIHGEWLYAGAFNFSAAIKVFFDILMIIIINKFTNFRIKRMVIEQEEKAEQKRQNRQIIEG